MCCSLGNNWTSTRSGYGGSGACRMADRMTATEYYGGANNKGRWGHTKMAVLCRTTARATLAVPRGSAALWLAHIEFAWNPLPPVRITDYLLHLVCNKTAEPAPIHQPQDHIYVRRDCVDRCTTSLSLDSRCIKEFHFNVGEWLRVLRTPVVYGRTYTTFIKGG
ncbi:hypothetical protein L209DRAFT_753568 [Thermothelomyces heterothallicus CBS 203.75]